MRKRPIKFRIPLFEMDGGFNSFSYWGAINSLNGAPLKSHDSFVSPSQHSLLLKGWHEQYIGFDDVKGNEIYEGDIVKDIQSGDIGIIKFSHPYAHGFYVRIIDSEEGDEDNIIGDPMWYSISDDGIKTLEVVGNIHANKDML